MAHYKRPVKIDCDNSVVFLNIMDDDEADGTKSYCGGLTWCWYDRIYSFNFESVFMRVQQSDVYRFDSEEEVIKQAIKMLPDNVKLIVEGYCKAATDLLYPRKVYYENNTGHQSLATLCELFYSAETEEEKQNYLDTWIQITKKYLPIPRKRHGD
jgi:hypothetical protein